MRWAADHSRAIASSLPSGAVVNPGVCLPLPNSGLWSLRKNIFFLNISCVVLSLCLGSFLMYSEKETSSKVFTSENSRTENSSQGPFP